MGVGDDQALLLVLVAVVIQDPILETEGVASLAQAPLLALRDAPRVDALRYVLGYGDDVLVVHLGQNVKTG